MEAPLIAEAGNHLRHSLIHSILMNIEPPTSVPATKGASIEVKKRTPEARPRTRLRMGVGKSSRMMVHAATSPTTAQERSNTAHTVTPISSPASVTSYTI